MIINHWHSLKNSQTALPDTTAPTVPTDLATSNVSDTEITLSWTASTDNKAVTGYDIQLNGSYVTTVTGTSYTYTGLSASTSYTLGVRAKDAAGNTSAYATTTQSTSAATPNIAFVTSQSFDLSDIQTGPVSVTGIQSGDFVLIVAGDNSDASADPASRNPSGFTDLKDAVGAGMASCLCYGFSTGTSLSLTFPNTQDDPHGGLIVVFRNVNSSNPIDTTTPNATQLTSSGTNSTPPNITTTTPNALVLTCLLVENETNTSGVTPPTGYTNVAITATSTSAVLVSVDSKLVASSGTTESFSSSKQYTHPADTSHAYTIALRKA